MGACLGPTAVVVSDTAGRQPPGRYNYVNSYSNFGHIKRMTPIVELTCDTRLESTFSVVTHNSQLAAVNRNSSQTAVVVPVPEAQAAPHSPAANISIKTSTNRSSHQPVALTKHLSTTVPMTMQKSYDKVDHFTPDVIAVFRNSYNAITGEEKKQLALNIFKRIIRTMPSAGSVFAAAAATASEDDGETLPIDEDGTASLMRKGFLILKDLESCLGSLHDPKLFTNIILSISQRQHCCWVVSRQILRVAIFSLESEILTTIKALNHKMPPDSKCNCPDSSDAMMTDDFVECFLCDSWKKFLQFLFGTFAAKINRNALATRPVEC